MNFSQGLNEYSSDIPLKVEFDTEKYMA